MRSLPVEEKSPENLANFIGNTISITTLKDPDEPKGSDVLETFILMRVSVENPLNYQGKEWKFICWVNGPELERPLPVFTKTKIWVHVR